MTWALVSSIRLTRHVTYPRALHVLQIAEAPCISEKRLNSSPNFTTAYGNNGRVLRYIILELPAGNIPHLSLSFRILRHLNFIDVLVEQK